MRARDKSYTDLLALGMFSAGSGRSWSRIGRGSVGWEILGFLAKLELGRGSFELMEVRPGTAPLEADRVNHFVGLNSWEKPVDGEAERGIEEPGERDPACGAPVSGGLRVLMDGVPRFGDMTTNASWRERNERSAAGQLLVECVRKHADTHRQNIPANSYFTLGSHLANSSQVDVTGRRKLR